MLFRSNCVSMANKLNPTYNQFLETYLKTCPQKSKAWKYESAQKGFLSACFYPGGGINLKRTYFFLFKSNVQKPTPGGGGGLEFAILSVRTFCMIPYFYKIQNNRMYYYMYRDAQRRV